MIIKRNINDLSIIIYCWFLINSNTRGISIRVKSREAPFANFIYNISPIFSEKFRVRNFIFERYHSKQWIAELSTRVI